MDGTGREFSVQHFLAERKMKNEKKEHMKLTKL
jgi:hypothetical protein